MNNFLSICLSVFVYSIYLSNYLSTYLSTNLSNHLSVYQFISISKERSDLYKLLCPSLRQFARTSLYRLLNASLLAPRSTFFQHLFMSNYPTCTELFSMFSCNIYLCTYIFIFVRFFVDAYQCEFTYLSEIPTYKHTYIHAILL